MSCYGCQDRCIGCHSECERYAEFKKQNPKKKRDEAGLFMIDRKKRIERWLFKKK